MATQPTSLGRFGLVVNGIVFIIIGLLIRLFVAPNFVGEWPEVLYMGCFIYGGGSILWAIKDLLW